LSRRICFLSPRFYPFSGGVEVFSYELTRRLIKKGYEVKVLTTDFESQPGPDTIEGIRIHRYHIPFFAFRTPIIPHIPLKLFSNHSDLIHVISTYPTLTDLALTIGKMLDKPVVVTHQLDGGAEGWLGRTATKLYHRTIAAPLIHLADRVVSTSYSYASSSPILSPILDDVKVIPNAVDETIFNPSIDGSEVALKYGLRNTRNVLFVGRLVPYKGLEYLLSAIEILQHEFSDIHLVIVGEGELKLKLVQLAEDLGIKELVDFVGHVPNSSLPPFYTSSDLVVLPSISRLEAFGIALIEAMACGKPVVASSIPGPGEIVEDGVTGYLVPPKDASGLAKAISLIIQNEDMAKRMGKEGRRRVEDNYTWERVTSRYDRLYNELLV
jgi:glycosyltransferase involved in cell wall biosynthesis